MITPRKLPYSSTTADPFTTQGKITKLLKTYGCEAVQWSEDFNTNKVVLRFAIEVELKGVRRKLGIEITPPPFVNKRRTWNAREGKYETIHAPNWAQSYRLLYWYLKTKLESIAYGLVSGEREFFAQVITKLPTGEQGTVFDLIGHRAIENQLPAPEPERKERVTERRIIDAEVVESQ